MASNLALDFSDAAMRSQLDELSNAELDDVSFGVIGFDADGVVRRYNRYESEAAGLSLQRVVGNPLFTVVAPCMNNYMVAQRFEDARHGAQPLDLTIDYVLTLRMRPIKVRLRLLSDAEGASRYVLVHRCV
ncbi:MAG: PAS domain-containing protein [Variovorax sp.]